MSNVLVTVPSTGTSASLYSASGVLGTVTCLWPIRVAVPSGLGSAHTDTSTTASEINCTGSSDAQYQRNCIGPLILPLYGPDQKIVSLSSGAGGAAAAARG